MSERTLNENAISKFAANLRYEEKSVATQEKYLRDVRAFYLFVGENEVSKEMVQKWKYSLIEHGYAARSVNSMLASLNSLLLLLGWSDCKVKNIRLQHQSFCAEDTELSKSEYLRLLKASQKDEQISIILQTLCATGIRVSELHYFTIEAIKKGEIVVNCKNKTRIVFIPGKLKTILLNYARKLGIKAGAIFLNRKGNLLDRSYIWRKMKQLCKSANVKETKVFPHNLRKLFARTFYAIEKDIAKLADILGHTSIETTRIYIMTSGAEHRRKIERLGLVFEESHN